MQIVHWDPYHVPIIIEEDGEGFMLMLGGDKQNG